MKEKTADIEGHRIKVGLDQHKSLSSSSSVKVGVSTETPIRNSGNKEGSSKNSLFVASSNHSNNGSNNNNNNTNNNNNFDDDYNEWDISIGDLIIDLDADIERQSEGDKSTADCTDKSDSTKTLPEASKVSPLNPKQLADISDPVSVMSSNLKSNRLSSLSSSGSSSSAHSPLSASNNSSLVVPTTPNVSNTNGASSGTVHHHHHSHNQRNAYSVATNNTSTGNNASNKSSSLVEHHATVDKGLKMKIKRKNIGGKISETKHEIVSSDISPQACKPYLGSYDQNSNPMPNVASNNIPNSIHGPNSALSSSNSVITANTEGVQSPLGDMSVLPIAKSSKHSNKIKTVHREKKEKEKIKFDKEKLNIPISSGPIKMKPTPEDNSDSVVPTSSSQTGIPNITVKYSSTLSPTVILKPEETQRTTPNINNQTDKPENVDDNISEKKSVGTTTSISTLTDPECLGPCEPGTSVTLEGIVWQETEGGVLVVNVTWRGKTYVGTLLDCTKHDWAPPRMCESPTSDIESKSLKNTRGKRARNSFVADNSIDTRSVTSKLRNGKGRRTANSGYIPPSPAKSDSSLNSSKRKGRPSDLDLSLLDDSTKRNRISKPDNSDIQPSSPILIECPEPNCSKKYKHINGLKYHQSHAHMGSTFNLNDSQDFDNTNSEPAAPCSSKDEASDSELNDSSMPDFGIKEISNSSEKFNNEFKNKLDNSDSCKTEKTYNNTPNNSHDIETKKLNNSANDELALESNKINAKSSDDHDKINPNSASQHDDNAINCDDLVKSFDEKNNEKNAPTDTECMSCDQPDDRFCDTNRDSVNISRDVIPSDNDLTSITKPANSIKPTIIPAITSSLNCKNVINAITTSNKVDDIANVPSPAYSDISDDTNNNDNTNELVLTQSNDKNDSSKELKKSQTPSNFSLSSFPSYFSQSQYITPTSTVDSKTRESTTKPLNETNEPPSDLSTDKSLQNSYPYSFFRFSSISSHDSKSVSENISKPNSSLDTRSSLSPSNKIECDSLTKDKTPENCKPTPKENDFREQPIVELQNLKNRIQNFAFDQGSLYDTQKRFISDSEKDKSKDKPKHSPQQPKPNLVKEEKEKNTTVKHEEGVKPTMETTGPPPPTNGYYYNPSFLSHTFPPISPFENMFRSSAMNHVVMGSPYGPHPSSFLHSQMRFPPMSALDGIAMANAVSRSSTHSPSSGPSTSNTSMKANSHHMSSLYNSNPKSDRGGILSPTSNHNSIPSSSHSLISSSAYHKSPNKDFTGQIIPSSHSVPVSSVSDQRSTLATVSASMHPPRHPLHSASHVGYPIFDPYSAMIVNHAANSVPMHPFTPK